MGAISAPDLLAAAAADPPPLLQQRLPAAPPCGGGGGGRPSRGENETFASPPAARPPARSASPLPVGGCGRSGLPGGDGDATNAPGSFPAACSCLGMEEDFGFLLCKGCRRETTNPKLLACLHTLCTECLEENKPVAQCPVCNSPIQGPNQAPLQDNLLFANLQAKLNTYQKIARDQTVVCNFCKGGAEFWCSECDEFLCLKCYEAHQWFLKRKSHEAQRLADLRKETAQSFLEGARKSCRLFCSEPTHNNQVISIYCNGCRKALCCCCALLDGEHYNAKLYRDIRMEIESRKEELGRIKEELVERKRSFESAHKSVYERLQKLERLRNETREQIQEKVDDMVQWIQQKGDELLEKVDHQFCQEQEGAKKKLDSAEQIIKRIEAGEQMVEKMDLFGSDQEVMDMHPFIKESLERLRKEKFPVSSFQMQIENFDEVRRELQILLKRVKGEDTRGRTVSIPGSHNSLVNLEGLHHEKNQPKSQGTKVQIPTYILSLANTLQGFTPSISPTKRPGAQLEKSIQASPKMLKLEECEHDAPEVSNKRAQEDGPISRQLPFRESTSEHEQRGVSKSIESLEDSPPGICETEVTSIVISSSEDTEDDDA
ncbi:protein PML isoform 3-T3 [Liasis olivaceus]